jgi:hypothetical protein
VIEMVLNNVIIFKGTFDEVSKVDAEIGNYINKPESSSLYDSKQIKNIKALVSHGVIYNTDSSTLKVSFLYKKSSIKDFIEKFDSFNVEIIHYCFNEKLKVWIIIPFHYLDEFQLIPSFAITEVLVEYMHYTESSIVLDSYQSIHLDRNTNKLTINQQSLTAEELLQIFYQQTIKNKPVYQLLESFTQSYYNKCINSYEKLYSNSGNSYDNNEEPSPFALFIVTFGIFAIIAVLVILMGYY